MRSAVTFRDTLFSSKQQEHNLFGLQEYVGVALTSIGRVSVNFIMHGLVTKFTTMHLPWVLPVVFPDGGHSDATKWGCSFCVRY